MYKCKRFTQTKLKSTQATQATYTEIKYENLSFRSLTLVRGSGY